jgi:ribosomal protein S18 acetylase RimI-like enzyme
MENIQKIIIRNLEQNDFDQIIKIAKSLPEWFTENGISKMEIDLRFQKGFVADYGSKIIGFLTFITLEGEGKIGWMGVLSNYHRMGIGSKLVDHLRTELKGAGVKSLQVYTLGDSVEYEPYARTRAFYRAVGFQDFRRIEQNDPECPEQLIMKMRL